MKYSLRHGLFLFGNSDDAPGAGVFIDPGRINCVIIETRCGCMELEFRAGMTEFPHEYDDEFIRTVLRDTTVIAVVGASPDWARPSCYTMQYMQSMGYRVFPINPTIAGAEILGRRVYGSITEVPEAIDMVNIFRKPEAVSAVVDEAISVGARVVWMQEGVRDEASAARARRAGLRVVMDRCPKKEHFRLFGGTAGKNGWQDRGAD
jgi:predicted CoA-binding protein